MKGEDLLMLGLVGGLIYLVIKGHATTPTVTGAAAGVPGTAAPAYPVIANLPTTPLPSVLSTISLPTSTDYGVIANLPTNLPTPAQVAGIPPVGPYIPSP